MKKSFIIAIVVAVVIVGGIAAYVATTRKGAQAPAPAAVQTPATPPAPAKPAILGATFSKSISATGEALNPADAFSPTEQNIYAVLSLTGARRTTKIAYVRKYNGKYVDSKVSHPSKDNAATFYFKWALAPGQTRKAGTYTLTWYVDGARSRTASYVVK